jgi:hypothetical protein
VSARPHDTLYGVLAIARFVGATEEETARLCESGALPCAKIGRLICASKTELRDWLAAYRAAAVEAGKVAP